MEQVQDKKSEFRALVNNILTFLILSVMTWVGINITQMKNNLMDIRINDAVTDSEIDHLHIDNKKRDRAFADHLGECQDRWLRVELQLEEIRGEINGD